MKFSDIITPQDQAVCAMARAELSGYIAPALVAWVHWLSQVGA